MSSDRQIAPHAAKAANTAIGSVALFASEIPLNGRRFLKGVARRVLSNAVLAGVPTSSSPLWVKTGLIASPHCQLRILEFGSAK